MGRREKTVLEGGKVAFEALEERRGGEGCLDLENNADRLQNITVS